MTRYWIVCTEQVPPDKPNDVAHIVAVGTGDKPESADKRWTLKEIYDAMDKGDTFYTKGSSNGQEASVSKYECKLCGRSTIRSAPDTVTENNLDNLRKCSWKS